MENMKRINNGYADYYYLFEDGRIYNSQTDQIIQANEKHFVYLRTQDNRRKKVALRTLYWIVYRKHYCIDEIQNLDGEVWKEIDNIRKLLKQDYNYYQEMRLNFQLRIIQITRYK